MKLAVVFVSYRKVPEHRLQDHFVWNKEAYEQFGDRLRVYVVTDVAHELPPYAQCLLFPDIELPWGVWCSTCYERTGRGVVDTLPSSADSVERQIAMGKHSRKHRRHRTAMECRRVFSLTKTKNAGNRRAIKDGADVIVCTDVDIVFQPQVLALMATVPDDFAAVPLYRMAPSCGSLSGGHIDCGCTGTVAMTAKNWRRISYEEKCIGYGADDGIILRDIERAGLCVKRDHEVTHVAHVQGDSCRTPGSGSSTCWGRDDGFNFDNFRKNRQLHRRRP